MPGPTFEAKNARSRGGTSSLDDSALRDVKRRVNFTWCPWSTDSDDDDRTTTSTTTSGSRHATTSAPLTASNNASRKRFIGGMGAGRGRRWCKMSKKINLISISSLPSVFWQCWWCARGRVFGGHNCQHLRHNFLLGEWRNALDFVS